VRSHAAVSVLVPAVVAGDVIAMAVDELLAVVRR
jgi:hypothetical protein